MRASRLWPRLAFFYKQSIHTTRGSRAKQFEPDVTLNARVLDATWFLEWDSYYDFLPDRSRKH
jgi:hypothetical protein